MQYSIDKRPRLLTDIKGQDSIIKDLLKRQQTSQWPKAMLFRGKFGTGKTSTAMAVALAMQCKHINDVGEPCMQCGSCRSIIEERFDRDTHMIDGSLLGNKDEVTSTLELVNISPMQDPKRLFIIEEANQLSNAAINVFHKILENPKPKVRFIFVTMDTGKHIPPSIQSRCQTYNFKPFSVKDTMLALKQVMQTEGLWEDNLIPNSFRLEGLASIANASRGSFRDALQYLERCLSGGFYTAQEIRDNLGIVDENTAMQTLFALLNKDPDVWIELNRTSPEELFNLWLTVMTGANVYRQSGVILNELYEAQTKKLANHPNFELLLASFDLLRESSKTYLRKSDLLNVLANYWKLDTEFSSVIPVRKRKGEA